MSEGSKWAGERVKRAEEINPDVGFVLTRFSKIVIGVEYREKSEDELFTAPKDLVWDVDVTLPEPSNWYFQGTFNDSKGSAKKSPVQRVIDVFAEAGVELRDISKENLDSGKTGYYPKRKNTKGGDNTTTINIAKDDWSKFCKYHGVDENKVSI